MEIDKLYLKIQTLNEEIVELQDKLDEMTKDRDEYSAELLGVTKDYSKRIQEWALHSTELQRKLDIAVEALKSIWNVHGDYCEHHINVSQHSYDLAEIAWQALKQLEEE